MRSIGLDKTTGQNACGIYKRDALKFFSCKCQRQLGAAQQNQINLTLRHTARLRRDAIPCFFRDGAGKSLQAIGRIADGALKLLASGCVGIEYIQTGLAEILIKNTGCMRPLCAQHSDAPNLWKVSGDILCRSREVICQ